MTDLSCALLERAVSVVHLNHSNPLDCCQPLDGFPSDRAAAWPYQNSTYVRTTTSRLLSVFAYGKSLALVTANRSRARDNSMDIYKMTEETREPDTLLVAAAKRGDRDAFDRLILRYQHRALCVAKQITRNREDAEDVVQESFQRSYLHLQDFEERSSFSTWLMRIVFNESFMLLRRRRSRSAARTERFEDDAKSISETFVDHHPSPELSFWHRERAEILQKAVGALKSPLRKAVWLREFEELSIAETAEVLCASVTTVKARLHNGRSKLRRILDPDLMRDIPSLRSADSPHA
jgi:RNA polymerase sigma-70 factor, ECF subfamily